MSKLSTIHNPSFYHPDKVGNTPNPDVVAATSEGFENARLNVPRASEDSIRTALILVDVQNDFILPGAPLMVPGAIDDTKRLTRWMLDNIDKLTHIMASLDTHQLMQIFFPPWWHTTKDRRPVDPFTQITVADLEAGKFAPTVGGVGTDGTPMLDWSYNYVWDLAKDAHKDLMVWPYHTLLGTPGHNLEGALYEVIAYHSALRGTQMQTITKGFLPQTENYSIFEPEVKIPGDTKGGVNTEAMDVVADYDLVYVAGQAKSHCVVETVKSMIRYWQPNSPQVKKMRILMDATSSVYHPDVDFEAEAQKQYEDWRDNAGLKLVTTKDPIG